METDAGPAALVAAFAATEADRPDRSTTTMGRPFDATTRNLFELNPAEWAAYLGHPVSDPGRVRLIDSNLSTITGEADRILRLEDPVPWLWNIELQAGRDLGLAVRLHFYSTLLHPHHGLPVRTTLILLREAASGPELTGIQEMRLPGGEIYDWFRYAAVKVWEQPVDGILAAGLAILRLAPVAKVTQGEVPGVLAAISERLDREATGDQMKTLWAATGFLMGLRYSRDEIVSFLRGVPGMLSVIRGIEEASLYQDALQEGEARGRAEGALEEARRILIRQGTKKFGPSDERAKAQIATLAEIGRLDDLIDRIPDVASWDELLGAANP